MISNGVTPELTTASQTSDPLGAWNTLCQAVVGPFAQSGRVQQGRMIFYGGTGGGGSAAMLMI